MQLHSPLTCETSCPSHRLTPLLDLTRPLSTDKLGVLDSTSHYARNALLTLNPFAPTFVPFPPSLSRLSPSQGHLLGK
jgi:hypothetical protein